MGVPKSASTLPCVPLRGSRASNWLRRQPVMFLMVGAYNTVFGLAVFALLYVLLPTLHYLGVLFISVVLSTANAFVAYRVLVFKVKGRVGLDLVRFLAVYAVTLGLNFRPTSDRGARRRRRAARPSTRFRLGRRHQLPGSQALLVPPPEPQSPSGSELLRRRP